MATKTFTFPASQVYVDSGNVPHTVTTSQTFALDMTDLGTTATYTALNASSDVTCTDGFKFTVNADPLYKFWCTADATATDEEGCLCVFENGTDKKILDVVSLDIDDADSPSTCTVILQHRSNPIVTMTWTGLTVA